MQIERQQFQGVAVPKQADVFEQLRQAQQAFADACRNFAKAQMERSQADQMVREATAAAHKQMEVALQDPTVPQPENPSNLQQANGRY